MSVILYVCRYAGSGIPLVTFHHVCMDIASKWVRPNHPAKLVTRAMVIRY